MVDVMEQIAADGNDQQFGAAFSRCQAASLRIQS
jgi:hypothetical protein